MPGEPGANESPRRRRIGLLGGTFDPVHVAHLALARAALGQLALDELRFVPTGRSWQKARTGTSTQQRLAMLRIATQGLPRTTIDERETHRAGASYTIDTLIELRAEMGEAPALVLIIGSDQLRNLPTWHRWEALLRYAHLAVASRAGDRLEGLDPRVRALVDAHRRDELPDAAAGSIVFFPMPPMHVSGSELRAAIARGEHPGELLPAGVLDYIERNRLYRAATGARQDPHPSRSASAPRRNRMDPRKLQRVVVDALDDIKAQDIRVFDTTAQTELFDRVIIATGTSNRQTRALAAHVRDKAKQAGAPVVSVEGADTGEWVLVDLGDIVVHVMQPAIRQYYNLEEIWGRKPVRLRIGEARRPPAPTKDTTTVVKRSAAKRGAAPAKGTATSAPDTKPAAKGSARGAKRASPAAKPASSAEKGVPPAAKRASPAAKGASPVAKRASPAAKRVRTTHANDQAAPATRRATAKRASNG